MRWHRLPSAVRVLILAAAWFSFGVVLSDLNSFDEGRRSAEVIWGACGVGFAITVLVTLVRPALFSSADEFQVYRTALRTGTLPDDVDLAVWDRRLSRSRVAVLLVLWFAFPYLVFGVLSADSSHSHYRVVLLSMFGLTTVWVCVIVSKRLARIRQLESAVRQRQKDKRPAPPEPLDVPKAEQRWRSNAETSMAERIISTAVLCTVFAFLPVLLVDLDSVVYSDSRGTHLAWSALCATVVGIAVTATVFGDPRLRATKRTIEVIVQYDRAFRTTELPDDFDVDQWRGWIKSHRRSDAITLIWAAYYLTIACWAIVNHPPGYHWIVATLLGALAFWQIRRWQYLCALNTRLHTVVERHVMRQLFG